MTTSEKLISNISYTNKDFNSIYPALLDLVKRITYRWDPSISNESDPGVILLKLNALIADKCNYNIDKNVLECFPLSVTQDRNARQLYEQLGYSMHWRLAASTEVTMRWIGDVQDGSVTIPKFTMVSDAENSTVYTLIDSVSLPLDGTFMSANALQGIAVNYSINGSTLITAENLDSDNRLYFDYNDVAENGIFIKNTFSQNYSDWKKTDNLLIEPVSATSRFYKFGVTQNTNVCYIEFPVNAQELFGDGVYITYIKTDGSAGNIAPFVLEKFYNDTYSVNSNMELNSDNVQLMNYVAAVDGEDPETIDDAYQNYKRTVGTFNTLVTLRDYINAIINYPYVSNAFVCDRTNDIQVSYDIMSTVNGVDQQTNVVANDMMTPFDLKFYMLYALNDTGNVQNATEFNNTFRLLDDVALERADDSIVTDALGYIEDKKHIAHNYYYPSVQNSYVDIVEHGKGKYKYGDIVTTNSGGSLVLTPSGSNAICLIKNKYPVSGRIIPQYKLTTEQKNNMLLNIRTALLNALNAQKIDFSEEMDYDYVQDIILGADERIKTVVLNDLSYETYAVYMCAGINDSESTVRFEEIRIDQIDDRTDVLYSYYSDPQDPQSLVEVTRQDISKKLRLDIATKSVLAGNTQLFIEDSEISPQLGQLWTKIGDSYVKDANYITTALNKSFDYDAETKTYQYDVVQNEAITLFAPNLIDTTEYTSYVKYEYILNGNHSINANESYMLQTNECIAFYWTADQDSGYNYAVYGEGTIIKPSFALPTGEAPGSFPDDLKNLLTTASVPKYVSGVTYDLAHADTVEQHISTLSSQGYVLSPSVTIKIQTTNQVVLNSDDCYCSWILNKKIRGDNNKDYYELFSSDPSAPNATSYRLKSGEYFLYTNTTRTSLVILGEGTLIERGTLDGNPSTWNGSSWVCSSYEYSSIISSGLDALVNAGDALVRIPDAEPGEEPYIVTATEMQFITLNSDSSLRLVVNDEASPLPVPVIDSTQDIVISPDDYTKIEYKGKTDDDYIELPAIMVNNQNWTLHSQLNLNMSKKHSQVLTNGQSLTIKSSESDSGSSIAVVDNTPKYVSSSSDIIMAGGENTDVSYLDVSGLVLLPKISTYSAYKPPVPNEDVVYTDSGEVTVKLYDIKSKNPPQSSTHQTIHFHFPIGKYVLVFSHASYDLGGLSVGYCGDGSSVYTPLHSVGDSSATDLKEPKTYYLDLEVDDDTLDQSIEIDCTFPTDVYDHSGNFIFNRCYKYSLNENILTSEDYDIFDNVVALNKDFLFNYAYAIPEDNIIENPLDSKSFFDPNHIWNKYTIAQLNTTSLGSIYITDTIRS